MCNEMGRYLVNMEVISPCQCVSDSKIQTFLSTKLLVYLCPGFYHQPELHNLQIKLHVNILYSKI